MVCGHWMKTLPIMGEKYNLRNIFKLVFFHFFRGLKASFSAFLNSKNYSRPADNFPLPGLKLTQNMLFFVSFAQVFLII